jgi:hypothetical protein
VPGARPLEQARDERVMDVRRPFVGAGVSGFDRRGQSIRGQSM